MTTLISKEGQRVSLGHLLGRGGEASVYEVTSVANTVAKVYHKAADASTAEKLSLMCTIGTDRLKKLTAWPITTLHDVSRRETLGVLMPNVSGYKDIHKLYTPKSRFREFPSANWAFLIHTAANTARAFAAIHEYGIVVGDVNESNVRAAPNTAMVTLIDCDSFQIANGIKRYLCEVGTPTYTPPELQGKPFAAIVRTANHDNFGLAVMAFHLLFMGRHPFAGRFTGSGEMPIERAIGEFRFAFSRNAAQRQMQPPPACLSLEDLPRALGDCFELAFSPGGSQSSRPLAKRWAEELTELGSKLRACNSNAAHIYYRDLVNCPWCRIEKSGIVFFLTVAFPSRNGTFNLEQVWIDICATSSPGSVAPLLPVMSSVTLVPSPAAQAAGRYKYWRWGGGALILLSGFGICFSVDSILPLIVAAVLAYVAINRKQAESPFAATLVASEGKVAAIQSRWNEQSGDSSFQRKRAELEALRNTLLGLPQLRMKQYQELERNKYNAQLSHYLEGFTLERASVPGIGPGRKAILRSYGFDDADDIAKLQTQSVPGIGPSFKTRLLVWRQGLVSKFVFNASQALDPNDVRRLDLEIAKRKNSLESSLLNGSIELKRIRAQSLAAREALQREFQIAHNEVLQARTDLKAACFITSGYTMRVRKWQIFVLGLLVCIAVAVLVSRDSSRLSEPHTPGPVPSTSRVGDPRLYPELRRTPGSPNPKVTQSNISNTICEAGWAKTVRRQNAETRRTKQRLMKELGLIGSPNEYELDHFIPLELGGCADCTDNLWLESYAPAPGAHEKDQVENYLHERVCDGSVTLEEAQKAIIGDWYKIYLEMHAKPISK